MRSPPPDATTPCAGCTACCRSDEITLYPEYGDRPNAYRTSIRIQPDGTVRHVLEHKPLSRECSYLGEAGCTIHDRAPVMCRVFDCGMWVDRMTPTQRLMRRLASAQLKAVVERGEEISAQRQARKAAIFVARIPALP